MSELKIAKNHRRNAGKYVLIIHTSTSCGACNNLKKNGGIAKLKKIILTKTLANFIHYEPKKQNKKLKLPNYIPCFKLYLTQDIIDISKKNAITSIDMATIKNGRLFTKIKEVIDGKEKEVDKQFNYMDFDFIAKVVNYKIANVSGTNNYVESTIARKTDNKTRKGGGKLRSDPRNKKNLLIPTASSSEQYYSGDLFFQEDSDSDDDFY